jgi:hypothetical protein
MKSTVEILLLVFLLFSSLAAQEIIQTKFGKICKIELDNTAFPHKNRDGGHVYKGEHFNLADHYKDKSSIVFIPNNYELKDSVNLVFYFHGWWNNIDTSITKFKLIEQFYYSKSNAVLVLTETAKNSPDSYGGHLEEKDVFKDLVYEIIAELSDQLEIETELGKIIIAGHSGAYRVMSYILMHGGVTKNITDVIIFDGLYADVEKYSYWLDNYGGRFINIYTPNGGTKEESENLMLCLNGWKIPYKLIEDDNFSSDDLIKERIIFIKSELGHIEVIHTKNQFKKFLESSF